MTVAPTEGVRAADEAVIVREMARAVAERLGHRAIFAPMLTPQGIGDGTHIHFSLVGEQGRPIVHEPAEPYELSATAAQFAAGVLAHMPAIAAVTAPSVASYYRLTPNRWAPTWTNLGYRDRGASLRVCPVFTPAAQEAGLQFNLEYRVADATASPYMALGAIVQAGLDGIRRGLALPPKSARSFWDMTEAERTAAGARRLPATLSEALTALEQDPAAPEWFGAGLLAAYLQMKRAEVAALDGLSAEAICARYADAY